MPKPTTTDHDSDPAQTSPTRASRQGRKRQNGPAKTTAGEVVAAVRRHYGAEKDNIGPEWAGLEEYSLMPGAGWRRADLFLMRCWRSGPKRHERHTIEVKVSRTDLRNELANPGKAAVFEAVSHRFYLAVPAGLIHDDDPIPTHWGIYEISARGTCRKVREATRRTDVEELGEPAVVEAFRRAARAETRIRTADDGDAAAQVVHLTAQLRSAERAAQTARRAAQRSRSDLNNLLGSIAAGGGWLCICGKPVERSTSLARTHADGTSCDECRYGFPQIDYGSIAARLGLTPPEADHRRCEVTPAEVIELARRTLAEAAAGDADPAETLAALGALVFTPNVNDPDDYTPDPAFRGDEVVYFGTSGP